MASMDKPADMSLSGLTSAEAREFHSVFVTSFIIYTVIAIVAHFLVWTWRPWLPSEKGYSSLIDTMTSAVALLA